MPVELEDRDKAATGVVALAASKRDAGIPCHQMDSRPVKKVV
jgi:hypothetical protein